MSGKYSRDDLYKLRASPLICKPAKIAAIEEILAAADIKTQRPPARRGADDANGATEGFVGRPLDSHRKSATDPDRIVLGPPRRSFASSNAKGPGRGTAENDDDQPLREKSGFGRFKDGDADHYPDKRINGRFSKHDPGDSTDEKPRRRFDNAHGDDRPRKDHERKPKWALDDTDGNKDPKPERLSRSKFEQSWLRPDRGAESLEDGRRDGDRAHDWRGKKQDRGWDRAAAVEDDPEWMDTPIDEGKQAPARTQEDFQRWKEKMKAVKTAPATGETTAGLSSPEPIVNNPTKSFAPIPDAEPDDSMDKFLARFDKTKITSEKAAATKAPTKTRFASLIMEMLKNRSNSQTPQNQEQKPKAPLYARDGHPPMDSDLPQHKLPLMAAFGRPQDSTEVSFASTHDHIQESRPPVDAQHVRDRSEKTPSLLDLLKQANQAAKPTPPRPRYGNEMLMGPINEASMREMANHSAAYGNQMISPDPAILPHYGRIENGRSPPLEDLGRRPTNAEGQPPPDQLLNFVRGYNQAPKPTNYQPPPPPPGIGRPPGLDNLGRPLPGWPGMPGGARNLGPAQFGGPGIVQGQRPQPPRKYTGDFSSGPPPGFMGVPPPGFQGTPSFYLKGEELFEFLCMTERDQDPTELDKLVCGIGLMQAPSPVYNAKAHNGTSGVYKEVFQVKDADDVKAVYQAGSTYNMSITGTATHLGGSCQISLSYDNGTTFRVIQSQVGGCSLVATHNFTIPSFAPSSDSVLLSWSWFNLLGNREMYQNCARVSIQNQNQPIPRYRRALSKRQASLDGLPNMFVCNVGNGCTTIELSEVVFPDPGDTVVYGHDEVTPNPGPGYRLCFSTPSPTTTSPLSTSSFSTPILDTNSASSSSISSSTATSRSSVSTDTSFSTPPNDVVSLTDSNSPDVTSSALPSLNTPASTIPTNAADSTSSALPSLNTPVSTIPMNAADSTSSARPSVYFWTNLMINGPFVTNTAGASNPTVKGASTAKYTSSHHRPTSWTFSGSVTGEIECDDCQFKRRARSPVRTGAEQQRDKLTHAATIVIIVMGYPDTFEAFVISDQKKWTEFKKQEVCETKKIKPKKFGDNDIDIKIECCGVCGSDLHTINGGWGEAPLPICVGHEIVGHAVRVGPKVKTVKVGDRVGVGAQIWSCLDLVDTYGAPYPKSEDPDETISQGGYASHIRAHEYFTFPIPDNIPSEFAAPMMCAGLTVWSPLVRSGIGPGKQVAIVGFGGLGHFGVIWANALGAEVTVISHSPHKKDDALKLGAKHFVVSSGDDWEKPLVFKFDMVLNTADMTHTFDIQKYLSICAVNAHFHQVGLPDEALPPIRAQQFMANGSSIGASHIGSRPEMLAMLKLASEKNLRPMVETLPVGKKGCAEAVERVSKNKVKYRFTLVDYDKAFPHRP
ncbi:hypothetical protein DV736_g5064, partial [Chaetothyriales sp. CBS 134916]